MTEEAEACALFPGLGNDRAFAKHSDKDPRYNCIAYAAGDDTRWWWPIITRPTPADRIPYWPSSAPHEETVAAFMSVFAKRGYTECSDGALEGGVEKVALYATSGGVPRHAARQLESGVWISKLGEFIDVTHDSPYSLEGSRYGTIVRFMRRRRS